MEMTECLQNCIFYRTIISIYSSELKSKLIEKLSISEDFSFPDLRSDFNFLKTVYELFDNPS